MKTLIFAFRTLRKTPFVTGIAVLSLALGIGANAAIYSLFDQMLLRSLPVQEPDRLVNFAVNGMNWGSTSCNQAGNCDAIFSYPMFRDLQEADTPFSGIAAHRLFGANLSSDGVTTSGQGVFVSGSYFPLLGVRPQLGRLLTPEDDRELGAHSIAVLSHDYWQSSLGGDPAVLNRSIVVNGRALTIVGVAAAGFTGTTMGATPDVFVPITMRHELQPFFSGFERRNQYWAYLFGRLEPGRTLETASNEINAIHRAIINDVEVPLQNMSAESLERFRDKSIILTPGDRGQSTMHSDVETPLRLLVAITAVVLLIACANIANLLLVRGAGRAQEMAVRGSLGAGRATLVRQLLVESLMLAAFGGLASLLVANWTLIGVGAVMPASNIEQFDLAVSPGVVMVSGVLAVVTGLLFGLYPALHATRPDLVSMLKAGGGQPSSSRSAHRFRHLLVTAQIALSMSLLVAAGLFIKSLSNVSRVDLNVAVDNLVTFRISPELNGYPYDDSAQLFVQTEEALEAVPGITSVTSALVPILTGSNWGNDVNVEGFENGPDIDSNARYNEIGPGYFGTLGRPLLAGREFTAADTPDAPPVAIVNEEFTRKFGLDGANAVGKFMSTAGAEELDIEIVGVVQDGAYADVKQGAQPLFFLPHRQVGDLGWRTFYVRSGLTVEETVRSVRRVVAGLDANLPVDRLQTLEQTIDENVFLDRMISTLSVAFAALATLLAAVGLYGVLAYTVAQRTREIGVRMALGAGTRSVRSMVLGQVGRMALLGGVVGLIAAVVAGRWLASLLFGMGAMDLWVYGSVALVLGLVVFGAGYLPARRASRVDPITALRYE